MKLKNLKANRWTFDFNLLNGVTLSFSLEPDTTEEHKYTLKHRSSSPTDMFTIIEICKAIFDDERIDAKIICFDYFPFGHTQNIKKTFVFKSKDNNQTDYYEDVLRNIEVY